MEPGSSDVCIWAAWIESEGKEELVREDTGVEQRKNYKIYKHLWYFSLYYMYFLCISSCHVLRGTVWSCVVEYFIVIILIFKWFFVFKFKLLICTLCIYNEVKVQLDECQFVSWHNLLEQYFLDIPTEMNRMAWSCKSIFHVHV